MTDAYAGWDKRKIEGNNVPGCDFSPLGMVTTMPAVTGVTSI